MSAGTHDGDRVEQALECGYDALCARVADFTRSDELDRFSRRYNVNDGLEPLLRVVRHSRCDAGTALFIYWQFHELLDDPSARAATDGEPARWNAHGLLAEIEQRYPQGFRHRSIGYDPMADYTGIFGTAYVAGIRALHPGSPLMQPLAAAPEASNSRP